MSVRPGQPPDLFLSVYEAQAIVTPLACLERASNNRRRDLKSGMSENYIHVVCQEDSPCY